jgi:hypothetical protein
MVTYFNGDYGLSLRYPASWKTEQAEQDGIWYRYFLGPPEGPERKPAVSVTLLAGPLRGSLEEYGETYLAGNTLASSRQEGRQGATGKSYEFTSADGATRHSLLLLQEGARVYGLYCQGGASLFGQNQPALEEMASSLTLERPASYTERRNQASGLSIRLPVSWKSTRSISGGGTLLMQFTSPALAADKSRQTVHASLTLTVEPLPSSASLESFYVGARAKLGESFQVLSHDVWKDGYVDVLRTETPMAESRSKRFYRIAQGRGYTLAFEAREDVFQRVSRWCDMISETLKIGAEVSQP